MKARKKQPTLERHCDLVFVALMKAQRALATTSRAVDDAMNALDDLDRCAEKYEVPAATRGRPAAASRRRRHTNPATKRQ